MSIISRETFEKFSKEEKARIQSDYADLSSAEGEWREELAPEERQGVLVQMEWLFDKEDLQPKPKIKTWEDVEFNINEHYCKLDLALGGILPTSKDDKLRLKIKAAYKITKLIELAYGGMVTEEEWKDKNCRKYTVEWHPQDRRKFVTADFNIGEYRFIAFHTSEQRDEFMSYESNWTLVEQYFMI